MTALKGLEFSSSSHLEFYILFIQMPRVLEVLGFCLGFFGFKRKGIYSEQNQFKCHCFYAYTTFQI